MVSTYTPNGRFTLQGTNDNPNTWGTILNQVIALVEESVFGVQTVDITGSSNVTLTTANGSTDESRHATVELTGALSADISVFIPSVEKQYFVRAAHTGGNVTFKISGSSTEIVLIPGARKVLYTNGTDIYDMVDVNLSNLMEKDANLSDVEDAVEARTNLGLENSATMTLVEILESVYPVHSIYLNTTNATNPGTLLGFGTWEAFGQGRVLIGAGTGTDVNAEEVTFAAGATGGEYEHTLTAEELPSDFTGIPDGTQLIGGQTTGNANLMAGSVSRQYYPFTDKGEDEPHNNIQPYIVVYMWRRTA